MERPCPGTSTASTRSRSTQAPSAFPRRPRIAGWRGAGRALARQPLLQFLLLGGAIFCTELVFTNSEHTITVTPGVRQELSKKLEAELGAAPTPAQLASGIRDWQDDEMLYREGLRQGLSDADAVIRSHVAAKMRHIARQRIALAEPTDAELREYLKRNEARFSVPPHFDVDHVFVKSKAGVPDEQRVKLLLDQLKAGTPIATLGDHHARGQRFTHRTADELERELGIVLSPALDARGGGRWQRYDSSRGTHLLRVSRYQGGAPEFKQVRTALKRALEAEERQRAVDQFISNARQRYRFVEQP